MVQPRDRWGITVKLADVVITARSQGQQTRRQLSGDDRVAYVQAKSKLEEIGHLRKCVRYAR